MEITRALHPNLEKQNWKLDTALFMFKFNNTYSKLPANFYTRMRATPVKNPITKYFNFGLANKLGLDFNNMDPSAISNILSGNKILEGSEPIAMVYAGHQFGYFVPQLGDGRAILLGEIVDRDNNRWDIQLKGAGRTPYSRQGDGRAYLGSVIKEYIVSEAMYALGVKTTRSLAIVTTGESVFREKKLPGAILTRIAISHIRIGTFEYFNALKDLKSIKVLADYVINRYYPKAKEDHNPYLSLFRSVIEAQVTLVVQWIKVGFIHGVMNTDNMNIAGETIDYGPCAFLDEYHANKVFSSIDYFGRYAFSNQINMCFWNLMQFSKTLSFLIEPVKIKFLTLLEKTFDEFKEKFKLQYLKIMRDKIGIIQGEENDLILIEELLSIMQHSSADYTLTFRYLSYDLQVIEWPFNDIFIPSMQLKRWITKWHKRLEKQSNSKKDAVNLMLQSNPIIIPRNHKIEEAIFYAQENDDFSKVDLLMQSLSDPYIKEIKNLIEYIRPPTINEKVCQTFCGT